MHVETRRNLVEEDGDEDTECDTTFRIYSLLFRFYYFFGMLFSSCQVCFSVAIGSVIERN
jgi:hypothetical protein